MRKLLITAMAAAGWLAATAGPAHAASCSGSTTTNIRGKSVELDQCARSSVTRGSTTYDVTVYYTETNSATNTAQCTATENMANRCEHALADADDANGDNANAKLMADEGAAALGFYIDRNLGFPPGSTTEITVAIGEDPRGGGINAPAQIYVDDEWIDQDDPQAKRLLAFHEMMHLIQDVWDDGGIGWRGWYGEGIARSIEDRVDPTLDADIGHLFIPELNGLMGTNSDRTDTATDTSYRSFLWWTWLWDQYRGSGDSDPLIGWDAIRDFYTAMGASSDQVDAVRTFISGRGGNFNKDWLDYTLSLWAYKLTPSDPRLTYLDSEIKSAGDTLSGHTKITGGPAFNATQTTPTVNARSVRFFEMDPASQCDFASFAFDGQGSNFGFSVLTADGSASLRDRWSVTGTRWTRTVRTAGLSRLTGAVTGLDATGPVKVGWGCVNPSIQLTRPTTAAYQLVGLPTAPRRFIAQVKVTGPGGEAIAGLTPDAFDVSVTPPGGPAIPATVVQGAFVQDTYWLLVQAPDGAAGAQAGVFHDLTVSLGGVSATQNDSLLYVERATDTTIVLDRSGSMADANKIAAARNGATLLTNELADSDQGGYVSFDSNAVVNRSLDPMTLGQRGGMEGAIGAALPGANTSIGDGLFSAAADHDANRDPEHACSFVLLSDGYENEAQYWSAVRNQVTDNGCAIHSVALGPEANEPLMQEIGASVAGGSYDYADVGGVVPVGSSGSGASGGGGAGGSPGASQTLDWQNNLSRLYDAKATKVADRQRLATFIGFGEEGCRNVDATVGFESRLNGSSAAAGTSFVDNQVKVGVDGSGKATFGAAHVAGGAGIEAALNSSILRFGLEPGCELQFRYAVPKRVLTLYINGSTFNTDNVAGLDGQTLAGVKVRVIPDAKGAMTGTIVLTGALNDFAVAGAGAYVDEFVHRTKGKGRTFYVDPTTTQLVTTVAWQTPTATHNVVLVDPNGNVMPASLRRSRNTNEVWTVPNPKPGTWTVFVEGLQQAFFVTETAQTDVALRLAVPANVAPGDNVPLTAFFAGPNGGVKGDVWATVTDPARRSSYVHMLDDGAHNDGEAGDGVYGGSYRATGAGDLNVGVSGENSPAVPGSYSVAAVGIAGKDRREDNGSFAVVAGRDGDKDGVPDEWVKRYGDPKSDNDRDGLTAACEYRLGTDPDANDSDGGGEADGSEADPATCQAITDPTDPSDDRISPLGSLTAKAEALKGRPRIELGWPTPQTGKLRFVTLQRRVAGEAAWTTLADGVTDRAYSDRAVLADTTYQYRVIPTTEDGRTGAPQDSAPVKAARDPYAPYGNVLINDGAQSTSSLKVRLALIAEDVEGDEHTDHPLPGTPVGDLEVRVSNRADFARASWQRFTPELSWALSAKPGQDARVYVQFRDAAGNVSTVDGVTSDSIRYIP
jgi:hypothetical protein